MASRIEELEQQLEQKRAAEKAARAAQDEADEIAVLEAKLALGEHAVGVIRLSRQAPGLPGLVVVRTPDKTEYKRFRDLTFRDEKKKALEFIQGDCRVYPDDATFARMREVFLELPDAVAVTAIALAKAGARDEGKV